MRAPFRTTTAAVLAAAALTASGAAPAAASSPHPLSAESVSAAHSANPAVVWIARGALRLVASWAVGHATDRVMDRIGVKAVLDDAINNVIGVGSDPSISPQLRRELRSMEGQLRSYSEVLARNDLADAAARRQLRSLHRDFNAHVRATDQRFAAVEAQIRDLEARQRSQLLMIVDLDRRVALVEGRLANAERRIMAVEDRVTALEIVVNPDPNRFLRHEAYLSGAVLYANSPSLGGDAAIGGELTAQYNFDQYFGVFAGLALMPLTAADAAGIEEGASLVWNNLNAHLGGTASLLSPRSPAGLQLGAGVGIASSTLLYHAPGVERTVENGQEIGSTSNVYMLLRGELGVAPSQYTFEPVISFGYMTFLDDVAYSGEHLSSNVGKSVWYVTLGLRFRQYLRGTPRRDTPAGFPGSPR